MSRPRWAAVGTLVLLAYLYLPDPLFLIAAIVVLIASGWVTAAVFYEQKLDVETERISLTFEAAGLQIDLKHMTEDYNSTLTRLSEVLDEHSLCPAPVEAVEEVPGLVEHTEQALRMISEPIVVEASNVTAFPQQRKGSKR